MGALPPSPRSLSHRTWIDEPATPGKQHAPEARVRTPGRGVARRSTHGPRAAQVALPQSPILLSVGASLPPGGKLSTHSPQNCRFAETQTVPFCQHHDTPHSSSRRTTHPASRNDSAGCVVATATTFMPAARAASMPTCASSKTTQWPGANPSLFAQSKNTSGSGLPCTTSSPATMARKYRPRPTISMTQSMFSRGVDEPMAHGIPTS